MPALSAPPAPAAPKPTATPAPAPAAPASKPAPSPLPAKDTSRTSSFFTDEDALPAAVDAEPAAVDKAAGDADPDKLPDDDAPPATDKPTVADKGTDPAKADDAAPEPVFRTNRELKKAYEAGKKTLKTAQARVQELEARVAELDGIATTAKGDTGPLAEQLAAAQKRIDEYEGRLRLKAYEESDEFKTKHLAPFKRAEARAFNDMKQLEYIEGTDETTGELRTRPANENDFVELYNMPTGKAYALAKRVFGDSSQLVMQHYHSLHAAHEDMKEAIADYRTRGAEEEKQTQARTAQEREAADRMWRTANSDLQAKYFKDLGVDADDAETKELLAKSYSTVDKLFSGNGGMTMAEKVGLQASVRQRAALFGVTRKQLLKAQADLAEANKTIEELRGSSPGKPKPKADAAPAGEYKDIADEMAAYQMET